MAIDSRDFDVADPPVPGAGQRVRMVWFAAGVAGCPAVAAAYYGGAVVIMIGAGAGAGVVGLLAGLVSGGRRWHPVKSFMATLALLIAVVLTWSILAGVERESAPLALLVIGLPAVPAATAAFCLGRLAANLLRDAVRRVRDRFGPADRRRKV